jgi:two-component system nitrate/nitrite response regulator NarL
MASSIPSPVGGDAPEATRTQRVRVLIADDTPLSCQLLKNALTRSRFRFEVVACATGRSEVVDFLKEHPVDVTLVSASLQDGAFAGFEALKELHATFPAVRMIILLNSAPRDLVVDAFRAGAEGVVCRTDPIEALCKCIQAVHQGQIWASSDQLHFVLEALVSATPLRVTSSKGRYLLTKKEDEVASLVSEGMTNREVAKKLAVTEHTVSNYLFRIYEKLGISTRVELALYVIRQKQGDHR